RTSILGVLTTTLQRPIGDLSHEIAPNAIPAGAQAGFLISSELFLRESVLPGLPCAFKNASKSDFQLSNHDKAVVLAPDVTVDLNPVSYGGVEYYPKLQSFTVQIDVTEIVIDMTVFVNISPGIDVTISMTSWQTLELVNKPDGTQTLGYKT